MMHADRGMTKMRRVRSKGTGSRERETEEWYLSVCAYILIICWGQPRRASHHLDRTAAQARWRDPIPHPVPYGIVGKDAQCVDEQRAARSDTPVRATYIFLHPTHIVWIYQSLVTMCEEPISTYLPMSPTSPLPLTTRELLLHHALPTLYLQRSQ